MAITAAVCVAAGFFGGLVLDTFSAYNIKGAARLQLIVRDPQPPHRHTVLGSQVWHNTAWGKNCTEDVRMDKGLQLLCQLPSIWKDCSSGIYIDVVSTFTCSCGLEQQQNSCALCAVC